jgi:hypothetical protein
MHFPRKMPLSKHALKQGMYVVRQMHDRLSEIGRLRYPEKSVRGSNRTHVFDELERSNVELQSAIRLRGFPNCWRIAESCSIRSPFLSAKASLTFAARDAGAQACSRNPKAV